MHANVSQQINYVLSRPCADDHTFWFGNMVCMGPILRVKQPKMKNKHAHKRRVDLFHFTFKQSKHRIKENALFVSRPGYISAVLNTRLAKNCSRLGVRPLIRSARSILCEVVLIFFYYYHIWEEKS